MRRRRRAAGRRSADRVDCEDVGLTAGQSDPVPRQLRVAGRLAQQRAGGMHRSRRNMVVITRRCVTDITASLSLNYAIGDQVGCNILTTTTKQRNRVKT